MLKDVRFGAENDHSDFEKLLTKIGEGKNNDSLLLVLFSMHEFVMIFWGV